MDEAHAHADTVCVRGNGLSCTGCSAVVVYFLGAICVYP